MMEEMNSTMIYIVRTFVKATMYPQHHTKKRYINKRILTMFKCSKVATVSKSQASSGLEVTYAD
jgi:hypothetical protein